MSATSAVLRAEITIPGRPGVEFTAAPNAISRPSPRLPPVMRAMAGRAAMPAVAVEEEEDAAWVMAGTFQ